MGGKRKQPDENYSSRSEILSKSRKPRNVCANVILAQTDQKIGCQERRFSRKLLVPSEPNCLVALVQLNDICMMVSPIPVEVIAVKFNINVVPVSGKKKKVP